MALPPPYCCFIPHSSILITLSINHHSSHSIISLRLFFISPVIMPFTVIYSSSERICPECSNEHCDEGQTACSNCIAPRQCAYDCRPHQCVRRSHMAMMRIGRKAAGILGAKRKATEAPNTDLFEQFKDAMPHHSLIVDQWKRDNKMKLQAEAIRTLADDIGDSPEGTRTTPTNWSRSVWG